MSYKSVKLAVSGMATPSAYRLFWCLRKTAGDFRFTDLSELAAACGFWRVVSDLVFWSFNAYTRLV